MVVRTKPEVIALMRRLGLGDAVERAEATLPDTVDLERDERLLLDLGLPVNVDSAIDRLGGSP
jgi:hypothetical protein